jgi:uncharacterized protein (DUF2141 family)
VFSIWFGLVSSSTGNSLHLPEVSFAMKVTVPNTNILAGIITILVAMSVPVATGAQSPTVGDITVVITDLRNTDGEVLISLYGKAEGFPRDRNAIIRSAAIPADASGQVTTVFERLPHGDYAIAVLHDEDGSLGMTFGGLHLPKEGYCFSNNVKVRFKPPKFKKASFTLDGDGVTQTLRIRY